MNYETKTITAEQYDQLKRTEASSFIRAYEVAFEEWTFFFSKPEVNTNENMIRYYNEVIEASVFNQAHFKAGAAKTLEDDGFVSQFVKSLRNKAKAAYSEGYRAKAKIVEYKRQEAKAVAALELYNNTNAIKILN